LSGQHGHGGKDAPVALATSVDGLNATLLQWEGVGKLVYSIIEIIDFHGGVDFVKSVDGIGEA
jgi:hypothetical protein